MEIRTHKAINSVFDEFALYRAVHRSRAVLVNIAERHAASMYRVVHFYVHSC